MAGNWPLSFATLDARCENLAGAGRTGFALYSFTTRRWKLFGNESQERDFVVAGGLLWLGSGGQAHVVMGYYNIGADRDEIRLNPRDNPRLSNASCTIQKGAGQILLLNLMRETFVRKKMTSVRYAIITCCGSSAGKRFQPNKPNEKGT
ncbi:hypothetical protein GHT06_009134 [Daphnia sinensis]|uniref:Uncharacterized protein n=1 Tax=Daphnia sinensis TaxID=1820382 RepID=A0AAD5L5H3_9CRUS|nr:hypothetical protein GHT06_009134 [Daphnia sinensis]